ncbi:MAG: bifunctional 5,10-methylenetetrahydrofolate dehydrogenase/5,10-methenyltetrahydrofolate cyclohydrolase [Candidatus Gracilibacteria bacterium]|nr:bifunctional 5,10-methylenetetrahydrofolate dehydrogenase/5,10-methenyltetrahydrofolate cyclohydrolase [Candidatus Gracilibacteria bacterium]
MIIDGKKVASEIYEELKKEVSNLSEKVYLKAILVGNNEDSIRYINQKKKWAEYLGIDFELFHYEENFDEQELLNKIEWLNDDKKTHGFIVQLPLPKHIDTAKVINAIKPEKDVDGFTKQNFGKLAIGDSSFLASCTPTGIMTLLEKYNIDVTGKDVVVIGRSNIVGKPLSLMMLNNSATITTCHSRTKDISYYTKKADIVCVAIGKPGFLTLDMINKNTIVIDVGFTVRDGKIYGDADFETINNNGNMITPVPGGVGAMTVAMLMQNTLKAYNIQNEK